MALTTLDPNTALIVIDLRRGFVNGNFIHRNHRAARETAGRKERCIVNWLWLVSYFFGGVFAANAIPHFVAGTMGRPFQSPFAKPPGQGLSSATVNVLWG